MLEFRNVSPMKSLLLVTAFLVAVPGTCQTVMTDRAAARFLDQTTWGPTSASIMQLQQMGIRRWLDWQFSLKSSDLLDQPVLSTDLYPIQESFFTNAVQGEDQLRQRVAFALSEIWVVSGVGIPQAYAFPLYWRIFRDNAFGNYRDIIKSVTLNPAMGGYLNMANNNKVDPASGTVANENYARELMQLFTLGLTKLNLDGSPLRDQSGQPISNFDASVVPNIAKTLTGWTYPTAPGALALDNNPPYYIGRMFPVERLHDTTAKAIFGNINIPAGQTAEQDLEMVLDALMDQPTMAPFVCRQMIQHLVTSNPSPAYVQRVSTVFIDNGRGVRGDLKEVIAAILTDPEARAGDDPGSLPNYSFGHMREPILFMANILRALNATAGRDSDMFIFYSGQLGETLFRAPSVFSYFSPQYGIEDGLLGPEFQIYSTQTALLRANIVDLIIGGGWITASAGIDLKQLQQSADNLDALLDLISKLFLHHSMSSDLYRAAYAAANGSHGLPRVRAALYIVLTSGEYQIIQ